MHIHRVLSALVFLPLFILLVLKGGQLSFWLLVTAAILLGLNEFYGLWEQGFSAPAKALGMGLGAGLCLALAMFGPVGISLLLTLSVILTLTYTLSQAKDPRQAMAGQVGTFLGLFYVAWLLGHLIWLRQLPQGQQAIFLVFLVTWSGDTAAYYVGTTWGQHRLAPKISPGKSVEGAVGGLLASIMAAYLARWWFFPMPFYHPLLLGILLGASGQVGDLCESLLKRGAQVKDSGQLIPGHGGILDRLDSLMFSAPCLYYYLKLIVL